MALEMECRKRKKLFIKNQLVHPNYIRPQSVKNGSPDLLPFAQFSYSCLNDAVCLVIVKQIPHFNACVYNGQNELLGKVDEIFGPTNQVHVSIRMKRPMEIRSFHVGQQFYIHPHNLASVHVYTHSTAKKRILTSKKEVKGKCKKDLATSKWKSNKGTLTNQAKVFGKSKLKFKPTPYPGKQL